jgi:hypothetical protein
VFGFENFEKKKFFFKNIFEMSEARKRFKSRAKAIGQSFRAFQLTHGEKFLKHICQKIRPLFKDFE